MILDQIITIFENAEDIAIMPHIWVDGDGLGSSLALGLALKKLNKNAVVYLEEDIPYIYDFLPGKELIRQYSNGTEKHHTVAALDCGDFERLGNRGGIFREAELTLNIDHHATNTEYALYNFVQPSSSAVGEIIYRIIKMMGIDIDSDISSCLYVAISTDTGGFRYSNTTALTHQIVSDLVNNGVNVAQVSQQVFETTSLEKVRLMGEAIKSLDILENGKAAIITLTDDMFEKAGANEADSEGLVNIARNINGVEVAAVLRKKGNAQIKGNLRSKSYADVSEIANHFNGGGHKRAAGFTVDGNLNEIKARLLEDIRKAL